MCQELSLVGPQSCKNKSLELMKASHLIFLCCFVAFVLGAENFSFAASDNSRANTEIAQSAKYDRTTPGMKKRFLCLRAFVDEQGIENFPSNQEIDTFISNVSQLEFISASSVTSGTDTKKISPFQLHKLGLSKTSIAIHKNAFVDLVNYEGTSDEYCAIKKRAIGEPRLSAEKAAQKQAEQIRNASAEAKLLLPALKDFVRTPNDLDIIQVGVLFQSYEQLAVDGWSPDTLDAYQKLSAFVRSDEAFSNFLIKRIDDINLKREDELALLKQKMTEAEIVLKNFVAQNLGSSQSNSALTLAQGIKRMRKEFILEDALNLMDEIDAWRARNSLEQQSKNEYRILRSGVNALLPSGQFNDASSKALEPPPPISPANEQPVVDDAKVTGTTVEKTQKTIALETSKQASADDNNVSQFPTFLEEKYYFLSSDLRVSGLSCDEVVTKAPHVLHFIEFTKTEMLSYKRDKKGDYSRSLEDMNSEQKREVTYRMDDEDRFLFTTETYMSSETDGECKFSSTYGYHSDSGELTGIDCRKIECSISGKQNKWMAESETNLRCFRKDKVWNWCVGKPKKVTLQRDFANYTHYTFSNKQGYNSTLGKMEQSINCHYDNGEVITIGMYLWQTDGCDKRISISNN